MTTPGLRYPIQALAFAGFAISILVVGCAAPGEPIERKTPVPSTVTDLAATQSGNDVVLTFTLPTTAQDRRTLKQTPAIEIYRSLGQAGVSETPVVTIPPAMVTQYLSQGRIRYTDSLAAADFAQSGATSARYLVRTSESQKAISAVSNASTLQIFPAPLAIQDVQAKTVQSAVVLNWSAPQNTITGSTPQIVLYRVYRAEVDSSAPPTTESIKLKTPLSSVGETDSVTYSDARAALGTPYIYSVRSVVANGGVSLESSDSNFAEITPRDTIPPSAPQGLLVVPVPTQGDAAAHFELSWSISPEPDIAGYNVYRSDSQGTRGPRQNPEQLLTPVFRDISVSPGTTYYYSVTAVDRSGNESPASEIVSGSLPAQ